MTWKDTLVAILGALCGWWVVYLLTIAASPMLSNQEHVQMILWLAAGGAVLGAVGWLSFLHRHAEPRLH